MVNQPTVIVDFDGTLWDYESFMERVAYDAQKMGIKPKHVSTAYDQAWSHPARRSGYSARRHAAALSQHCDHDEDALHEWLAGHHDCMGDFVFPDAHLFLDELRAEGYHIVLLTHGDPTWQMIKFRQTGLARHFDAIYPTRHSKADFLKDWVKEETGKVLFVNDNPVESFDVAHAFPRIAQAMKLNVKTWEETLYKKVGHPYFGTLDEIRQYAHTFFAAA